MIRAFPGYSAKWARRHDHSELSESESTAGLRLGLAAASARRRAGGRGAGLGQARTATLWVTPPGPAGGKLVMQGLITESTRSRWSCLGP